MSRSRILFRLRKLAGRLVRWGLRIKPEQPRAPLDVSLLPENFDPVLYLKMNPDLVAVDPVEHYLDYGRHESWRIKTLPQIARSDTRTLNPALETVLIVSHEASRSGAPILALNMAERFSSRYNVVVLLMADEGPLLKCFQDTAIATMSSSAVRNHAELAQLAVQLLCDEFEFKFAVVGSMECNIVLEPLARNFVACIYQVHEFASAYANSSKLLSDALLWAGNVVFSAELTRDSAQELFPALQTVSPLVIPQGRCRLPDQPVSEGENGAEGERLRNKMRPDTDADRKFIVLGAGYINYRKGVDLFIQCAAKAMLKPGGERFRFVWIGKGYNPEVKDEYSVYLADQIKRSGLQDRIVMLGETSSISTAYEEADVLLISSRLDPLPNVAIDAMAVRLPVVCFDKTTGISDFLADCGLREVCIAEYLDVDSAVNKIFALGNSSLLCEQTASQTYEASAAYFDMNSYVEKINALGGEAAERVRQEKLDVDTILASCLLEVPDGSTTVQDVLNHVREKARGLKPQIPYPAFDGDAYLAQHGVVIPHSDPLADYIRAGYPQGAWNKVG